MSVMVLMEDENLRIYAYNQGLWVGGVEILPIRSKDRALQYWNAFVLIP